MALNITSPLTTANGITLATSYGRVAVLNPVGGNQIEAGVDIYPSEDAFEAGYPPVQFNYDLRLQVSKPYNYDTDTKDILDLGHDMLVEFLAGQGVTAVKILA